MSNSSVSICAKSIDEEGLTRSLFMEVFNDFWREGLPNFISVLREEFLHMSQCKIGQVELILDIEGRDGPVVTQLCDAFNPDNTDTVRTSGLAGEVDVAE